MVTMLVANFTTKIILVDNSSSMDILFWKAFPQMGIDAARLQPTSMPLKGFSKELVQPIRTIMLSILVGNTPYIAPIMVNFLVVKAPLSFDAIIGQILHGKGPNPQ